MAAFINFLAGITNRGHPATRYTLARQIRLEAQAVSRPPPTKCPSLTSTSVCAGTIAGVLIITIIIMSRR
jgi:hypothetical protein